MKTLYILERLQHHQELASRAVTDIVQMMTRFSFLSLISSLKAPDVKQMPKL